MIQFERRSQNIHRIDLPLEDGTMSAVHFGPLDKPVKLVFLHANGFNGLSYRSILEPLGIHVISLDLRGHGLTNLPTEHGFSTFHAYSRDVISYLNAYVPGKVILAGHSLGASAAILAARKAPEKISRVLAFDPIVLPLYVRMVMATNIGRAYLQKNYPIARNAGRRRDVFSSLEGVFKRFHGRGPFKNFPDEALWDYIIGGFIPIKDTNGESTKKVRLACRPSWEQATYTAQSHNLKSAIANLPSASAILITDFVKQGGWIKPMLSKRPDLQITHQPKLDHFFPVINPEISTKALVDILK